jgi:23S rRNA (guanosine2251-2'-O)-methyltransferase
MDEWVFGRRPVWEVLQAGKRSLHKLWIMEGIQGGQVDEIVRTARERGVPIEWTNRKVLDQKVRGAHHQGLVAQVSAAKYLELDDFLRGLASDKPALVILLDEIQDPHNVGAILRTAGFFNVAAAVIPRWRSSPVSEAAVRVSAGAAEHLVLIRVGNLVQSIDQLKEAGFEVAGAEAGGEPAWNYAPPKRLALVVGNEGKGLRRLVREHCDRLIGIPLRSAVGSLNVASASSILLYEMCRPK